MRFLQGTVFFFLLFVFSIEVFACDNSNKTPINYFFKKHKVYKQFSRKNTNLFSTEVVYKKFQEKEVEIIDQPIIPFFPFAVKMNQDIVLAVNHDNYSMYEIIRVTLPGGMDIWFTLDTKFDGSQYIGLPSNPVAKLVIKELASTLGVKTYEANLTSPKIKKNKSKIIMFFQFVRHDPDLEEPTKTLSLEVTFSEKEMFKHLKKNSFPHDSKRNSHGMNHSESLFFVIVDIYRSLPVFNKMKVKFWEEEDRKVVRKVKFQKILGFPIYSMISQLVFGIKKGENLQTNKNTQELSHWPIVREKETSQYVVYTYKKVVKNASLEHELQNVRYYFLKRDSYLELFKIELRHDSRGLLLALVEFNPALPDLRYLRLSEAIKIKTTISLDGKEGISPPVQRVFFDGILSLTQEKKSQIKVSLIADKASETMSIFSCTNESIPEWFLKRPVTSLIDILPGQVRVDSFVGSSDEDE